MAKANKPKVRLLIDTDGTTKVMIEPQKFTPVSISFKNDPYTSMVPHGTMQPASGILDISLACDIEVVRPGTTYDDDDRYDIIEAVKDGRMLPCPFCGRDECLYVIHHRDPDRGNWFCECQWCGATTHQHRPSIKNAIDSWNRRPERPDYMPPLPGCWYPPGVTLPDGDNIFLIARYFGGKLIVEKVLHEKDGEGNAFWRHPSGHYVGYHDISAWAFLPNMINRFDATDED